MIIVVNYALQNRRWFYRLDRHDCDQDRADNQQLTAVYSRKLGAGGSGTKHWLYCDQGDSSGAGNTAVNTANINTFNTTHGVLFSLHII